MGSSSLEGLEQILAAFYGAQSADVRKSAETALNQLKTQPGIWQGAMTCLRQSSSSTPAAQFFCLTIIWDKVRHQWEIISTHEQALLRSELMQALQALQSGLLQQSRDELRPVANKAAEVLAQIALVDADDDLYRQHIGQLLLWVQSPEIHICQAGCQALLITFEDFASTSRDGCGKVLAARIPSIRRRLHSLLPALLEALSARVIGCCRQIEGEASGEALAALTLSLSSLHQLWAGMHQYGGTVSAETCSKELIGCLLDLAARKWPACYTDAPAAKATEEAFACIENLILLLSSQLLGQQRDLLGQLLQLFQVLCERLLQVAAYPQQDVLHPTAVLVRPLLSLFRLHFQRLQSSPILREQLAQLLDALGHLAVSNRDLKASLLVREVWQVLLDNLVQAQMLAEDAVDVNAALATWTYNAVAYKGAAMQIADVVLDSLSLAPSNHQASALVLLDSSSGSGEVLQELIQSLSASHDDEGATLGEEDEDPRPVSEVDVHVQASTSLLGLIQSIFPRETMARFLRAFSTADSRHTAEGPATSRGRNDASRALDVALSLIAKCASDLPSASDQDMTSLRLVERLLHLAVSGGSDTDTITGAFQALSSIAAGWLPSHLAQAGDTHSAGGLVQGYWQAAAPVFLHAAQHGRTSLPLPLLRAAGSALLALTSSALYVRPSLHLLQALLQSPQVKELSEAAPRLLSDPSEAVDSGTVGLWVALSDLNLRIPLDTSHLPARGQALGILLRPLVAAIEAGVRETDEAVARDAGKAAAVLGQIVGTYRTSHTSVRKALFDNGVSAALAATLGCLRLITSRPPFAATEAASAQLLQLLTITVDVLQQQMGVQHLSEMLGHVIDTFKARGGTRVLFGGEAFRALLRIVVLATEGPRSLPLLASSLQLCDALWEAPQEAMEDQLTVQAAVASALLTLLVARWKDLRAPEAADVTLAGSVLRVLGRVTQVLRAASTTSLQPEDARCLLEYLQEAIFATTISDPGKEFASARGPLMAALCDTLISQRQRAHQDTLLAVLYSLAASDNLVYFRNEFLSEYVAQLSGIGMQEQQILVEHVAAAAYDESSFNDAVLGLVNDVIWYQFAQIS